MYEHKYAFMGNYHYQYLSTLEKAMEEKAYLGGRIKKVSIKSEEMKYPEKINRTKRRTRR